MERLGPVRSALFVPGNRPERVDKAVNAGADAVIIDLEDAVPLSEKEQTRSLVRQKVIEHKDKRIIVRVNGLDSPFIKGDLEEVLVEGLFFIMVPKVESSANIHEINRLVGEIEDREGIDSGAVSIIPLIESAKAIANIYQIVSTKTNPDRLYTVGFGAADFTLDTGMKMTMGGEELIYPRSKISVACRAGGVLPPLDTPFMIAIKDMDALEADARRAKQLGFQGKLCVHPNQVAVCNRIFSPSADEIAYAQKVIEAFHKAEEDGVAAIQLNGQLIDYPIVEQARRILDLAKVIEAQSLEI